MLVAMPERVRMIFDADDRLRRAIRIRAARTDRTISEVIQDALAAYLIKELEEEPIDADQSEAPKPRRGRKPRDS